MEINFRVGQEQSDPGGPKISFDLEPEARSLKNEFPSYGILRVPHHTGAANWKF